MKSKLLLLSLFIFGIFILNAGYVHGYQLEYWMQDDRSLSHNVNSTSVYWNGNCQVNTTLYAKTLGTSPYDLINTWYQPYTNIIQTSTFSGTGDISCINLGTSTGTTDINDYFTSKSTTTTTADYTQLFTRTLYDCEPDSNYYYTIKGAYEIRDPINYYPHAYCMTNFTWCATSDTPCPSQSDTIDSFVKYINSAYYAKRTCDNSTDLNYDKDFCSQNACSAGGVQNYARMQHLTLIPFRTASTGEVNFSLEQRNYLISNIIGFTVDTTYLYLYRVSDNSTTQLSASLPYYNQLKLSSDEEYWLIIGECTRGIVAPFNGGSLFYNYTNYNISIWAYEPDYVCGEYSECDENGYKRRTCIDSRGIALDKNEYIVCSIPTLYERNLGFEIANVTNVYTCQPEAIACSLQLDTISIEHPENWTVIGNPFFNGAYVENTVRLISDYSVEGSKSLQMNYIPPKGGEPWLRGADCNTAGTTQVLCCNKTSGSIPEITHPLENSTYISTNITFPGDNPEIRLAVKKCPSNVLQYDARNYTWGGLIPRSCGQFCYSQFCEQDIKGNWKIIVEGWDNRTEIIDQELTYNLIEYDDSNLTVNVTGLNDGSEADVSCYWNNIYYANITLSDNRYFENGMEIRFNMRQGSSSRRLILTNIYYNETYGEIQITASGSHDFYNITLVNITNPTQDTIVITNSTNSLGFTDVIDYIEVIEVVQINSTYQYISQEFIPVDSTGTRIEAPDQWTRYIFSLTELDMSPDGKFTIHIIIDPESQYDPSPHCVLFDEFNISVAEIVLTEEQCVSICSGNDRIERKWVNGIGCIAQYIENSILCITESLASIRNQIQSGTYTVDGESRNWYCDGTTYYSYNNISKEWIVVTNSLVCIDAIEQEEDEVSIVSDSILYQVFGIYLGAFDFFFSQVAIAFYIILTISSIISSKVNWQFGIIGLAGLTITASIARVIPWYYSFVIALLCIILFAFLFSKSAGGE